MTQIQIQNLMHFLFEILNFEHCFEFCVSDLGFPLESFEGGLCSFEEIDPIPFLQGDDGLFPIRPLPVSSPQSLYLAHDVRGSDLEDLHLEEAFNS